MSHSLPLVDIPNLEGDGKPSFVDQARNDFTEVRDYLTKEITEMELPWEPLPAHSGYFLVADITKCRELIPQKFFDSHHYDLDVPGHELIPKVELYMPNGKIPLDLAFCRWMASVNKVAMMPLSFFYHPKSQYINDSFARLAICKPLPGVKAACQALRKITLKH